MESAKRLRLDADIRKEKGRKVKKLRREGKVPANVFGKKVKSRSLAVSGMVFGKLYRKVGKTTLVDLVVSGEREPRPVLVTQVQRDPLTDHIIHVDFHQVDLTEKVIAAIPVRIVGEAPAVKNLGAVLVPVLLSIPVEALPTDLPDHFEADISGLAEFGNSIHVKDLSVDRAKVKLMADDDETVVTVQAQKAEEEKPVAPAATEGEAAPSEAVAAGAEGEKKTEAPKVEPGKSKESPKQNEAKK